MVALEPSLISQILVLSDLSYELYELLVTELKFLGRNLFL